MVAGPTRGVPLAESVRDATSSESLSSSDDVGEADWAVVAAAEAAEAAPAGSGPGEALALGETPAAAALEEDDEDDEDEADVEDDDHGSSRARGTHLDLRFLRRATRRGDVKSAERESVDACERTESSTSGLGMCARSAEVTLTSASGTVGGDSRDG